MTEEAEQGIGFIAEAADPLKVAKAVEGWELAESARRKRAKQAELFRVGAG